MEFLNRLCGLCTVLTWVWLALYRTYRLRWHQGSRQLVLDNRAQTCDLYSCAGSRAEDPWDALRLHEPCPAFLSLLAPRLLALVTIAHFHPATSLLSYTTHSRTSPKFPFQSVPFPEKTQFHDYLSYRFLVSLQSSVEILDTCFLCPWEMLTFVCYKSCPPL